MSKAKLIPALIAAVLLTAACSTSPTGPEPLPAPAATAADEDAGSDNQTHRQRRPRVYAEDGDELQG